MIFNNESYILGKFTHEHICHNSIENLKNHYENVINNDIFDNILEQDHIIYSIIKNSKIECIVSDDADKAINNKILHFENTLIK